MRDRGTEFIEQLATVLRFEEGERQYCYDDATGETVEAPVGKLSIGIGHNLQAKGLSEAIIAAILKEDIEDAIEGMHVLFSTTELDRIATPRLVALTALAFQLGTSGLSEFARMKAAIVHDDWSGAARELLSSLLARQCPARTKRTAQIFESNAFPKEYQL